MSSLFALALYDYRHMKIPNKMLLCLLVFRVIFSGVESLFTCQVLSWSKIQESIFSSLLFGGLFLVMAMVAKNRLGFGDVKLIFTVCLYFDLQTNLIAIFLSLLNVSILCVMLVLSHRGNIKTQLPLAPSIAVGYLFAVLILNLL